MTSSSDHVINIHGSPDGHNNKLANLNIVSEWHYPGFPFSSGKVFPALSCGDRIQISRRTWPFNFYVWGLILQDDTVVVFGNDSKSRWGNGENLKVVKESLKSLAGVCAIRINNEDDERFQFNKHNVPDKQVVWRRYQEFVESWKGHMNKRTNHNEAFVNYCRYGLRFSHEAGVYAKDFPKEEVEETNCIIL